MTDFQKALAALKTADISFIAPNSSTAPPPPRFSPRIRRSIRRTPNPGARADQSNPNEVTDTMSSPVVRGNNSAGGPAATETRSDGKHKSTASVSPDMKVGDVSSGKNATTHTRLHIDHDWPPVGTIVSGNYFGTVLRAEVVKANKPLKSGRQLKLLGGPLKGRRFDTFTKALLVATARQRKEAHLGRRQASNGWGFWKPESPVTAPVAITSAADAKAGG